MSAPTTPTVAELENMSPNRVLAQLVSQARRIENAGGGGGGVWGSITGTLSDQTDLQSALDGKSGTIVTGKQLWVDSVNGDDANTGTLAAPFLTIPAAVAAATSGDRINVGPGDYVVNTNIMLNGLHIHCESGVTITTDEAGAGPFKPTGAVTFRLTGRARIIYSPPAQPAASSLEDDYFIGSYSGNDIVFEAESVTLISPSNYTLGAGNTAPAIFFTYLSAPNSKYLFKLDKLASSGGTDIFDSDSNPYVKPGNRGLWWGAGDIFAHINEFNMTDAGAVAVENSGGSEEGADMYVTSDLVKAPIGVSNGSIDTEVMTSWLNFRYMECETAVSFEGQSKLYLESQKIKGKITFNAAEGGLCYIRTMKTESAASDSAGSILGVSGSGSGVLRADLGQINVLHSGDSLVLGGTGTTYLTGKMIGPADGDGISVTGGTVKVGAGSIVDTTANSSTSAVSVSGGTCLIMGSEVAGHASGYDVLRTAGTAKVAGGYGSGTNGNMRVSGTVSFLTPV